MTRIVTVKPLVWESLGLEMWVDSISGKYYITGHGGKWAWTFDDDDPYHHGKEEASEDACKAAAQADYEARILSAINVDLMAVAEAATREAVRKALEEAASVLTIGNDVHPKSIKPRLTKGPKDMALKDVQKDGIPRNGWGEKVSDEQFLFEMVEYLLDGHDGEIEPEDQIVLDRIRSERH